MKVLGFDFGMKYIGVAYGQAITKSASPVTCLRAQDGKPDWQEIDDLITDWRPETLVVGLPVNMDGSYQEITFCAKKFANRLQHRYPKIPVELVDERLSTWEAKQRLAGGGDGDNAIARLNAAAAAVLVEQWLGA